MWLVLMLILFWLSQTWPVTWGYGNRCFLVAMVLPDSKEAKLWSSNQEGSPSPAGKSTGIVLMQCHALKCFPKAISGDVDVSGVPGCHLLWQMNSQWDSQKLLQGLVFHKLTVYLSVFNLFLTQWIMAILSKRCKPDNLEPHNSLGLSFTNIWGLHCNLVECESFLGSNSCEILALCYNLESLENLYFKSCAIY